MLWIFFGPGALAVSILIPAYAKLNSHSLQHVALTAIFKFIPLIQIAAVKPSFPDKPMNHCQCESIK